MIRLHHVTSDRRWRYCGRSVAARGRVGGAADSNISDRAVCGSYLSSPDRCDICMALSSRIPTLGNRPHTAVTRAVTRTSCHLCHSAGNPVKMNWKVRDRREPSANDTSEVILGTEPLINRYWLFMQSYVCQSLGISQGIGHRLALRQHDKKHFFFTR